MDSPKLTTTPVHILEYPELDELIEEHYGRSYEFVADQEVSNDTAHHFLVGTDYGLPDYDRRRRAEASKWCVNGSRRFMTQTLLDVLAERGRIPAGHYLILVSW